MSKNHGRESTDSAFEEPVLTAHSVSFSHAEERSLTPNQRVANALIEIDPDILLFLMPKNIKDSRNVSLVNFSFDEIIEIGKYVNEKLKEYSTKTESLLRDQYLPNYNKLDRALSTFQHSLAHAVNTNAEHFDMSKETHAKITNELSKKDYDDILEDTKILQTGLSVYHLNEYEKNPKNKVKHSIKYLIPGDIDNLDAKAYDEWNERIQKINKLLNPSIKHPSPTETTKAKIRKDSL